MQFLGTATQSIVPRALVGHGGEFLTLFGLVVWQTDPTGLTDCFMQDKWYLNPLALKHIDTHIRLEIVLQESLLGFEPKTFLDTNEECKVAKHAHTVTLSPGMRRSRQLLTCYRQWIFRAGKSYSHKSLHEWIVDNSSNGAVKCEQARMQAV